MQIIDKLWLPVDLTVAFSSDMLGTVETEYVNDEEDSVLQGQGSYDSAVDVVITAFDR